MRLKLSSRILDMYSAVLGQSPLIDDIISKMQKKVHFELQFQKQLLGLNGALEMVLAQVRRCEPKRRSGTHALFRRPLCRRRHHDLGGSSDCVEPSIFPLYECRFDAA